VRRETEGVENRVTETNDVDTQGDTAEAREKVKPSTVMMSDA